MHSILLGLADRSRKVFTNHSQYPPQNIQATAPNTLESTTWQASEYFTSSTAEFPWDGNVFPLADSDPVDASQLWLWADNLGYQSFAELSGMQSLMEGNPHKVG